MTNNPNVYFELEGFGNEDFKRNYQFPVKLY